MKSTVENLSPTKVKIAVEVPYEEFKPHMDHVFKDFARKINVPGFRPGKAPARVVESFVGRGAVLEEAVNHSLPEYYGQAIEANQLTPLGKPEVDVTETPALEGPAGGDLKFSVEVEVRPEIKLPDFAQLELVVDAIEEKDADGEEELTNLRRRFATLKDVKRAVKNEDFVTIDLVTKVGDEEVDNMSQTSYHVGSAGLVDGLDKALKGMKAGESKDFESQLKFGPHGGETAQVTVKVDSVKEQVLPEADDEFAQMTSEHDTIEELRADLKESALRSQRGQQALEARDKLVEKLVAEVEFPLPEGLVSEAIAEQTDEKTTEKEKQEITESVEREIKTQLILDALSEERQMNVSQEELLQFVLQTAQAYGMDPSMLLQNAEQNNRLPQFIAEIARNKAVANALGEVKVKDSNGQLLDLAEFVKTDEADEAADEDESAE